MINETVINEIYKKFGKPPKNNEDLRLDYYIPLLNSHHSIESDGFEIIVKDLEEFNPFRRFLIRSLNGVLEFDKMVAFVFKNHILFFGKEDNQMRVHIKSHKPKRSLWNRIFRRNSL